METSDVRHGSREPGEGPIHPRLRAGLLMAGVVLVIVLLSMASMR